MLGFDAIAETALAEVPFATVAAPGSNVPGGGNGFWPFFHGFRSGLDVPLDVIPQEKKRKDKPRRETRQAAKSPVSPTPVSTPIIVPAGTPAPTEPDRRKLQALLDAAQAADTIAKHESIIRKMEAEAHRIAGKVIAEARLTPEMREEEQAMLILIEALD